MHAFTSKDAVILKYAMFSNVPPNDQRYSLRGQKGFPSIIRFIIIITNCINLNPNQNANVYQADQIV